MSAKKAENVKPAETIDTAGAPQQIVPDVDMDHPAVDNDPRAGTSAEQNKIDFNDPDLSGSEAVAKNLKEQAKK
ncbi:hypothetical protein [Qipengyuania atrilutea]|uniref:Uncharacterized protein n=1 Tax=Qipengyuania atrilutea TaxID=2744473 RepID=A0A850GZ58_9SPHN|nr:hypothetical protein [Actirhodobacter atriluteus]NVD43480.1 hypothetical protein [Actirhodobacter atriluteus]